MRSNPHSRARSLRRIAAAAGIALGAGIPVVAFAEAGPRRPATMPDPTEPAPESEAVQTMAIDADAIAEAKSGLSTFLGEHAGEVGSGPVFLQPDVGCPALPVDNLVWFADSLGIDADPLSAFASVDTAERAAPDLNGGAAAQPGASVAESDTSAAEPGASTAEAGPAVNQVLVATCGFGVASGGAAAPSTTPATGSESAGPPPAEGVLLRVALFDDSTFADDVVAQHPDAQVVSPTTEGLEGELVGYCTPATGAGASDCTVWWHDDGLGIGIELTGPTATFDAASGAVEAMTPSVVATLRAPATGEAPDIPPPPTVPEPTITGESTEPTEPPSTPPSSDPPGGGTIEFPAGEDSATVEGELGEGIVDTWTLSASTGQTMEVLVYTDARNAAFSLYGPNGDRLAENVPSWTGDLPADGEYVIEVTSIGGQAVYELAVVIT